MKKILIQKVSKKLCVCVVLAVCCLLPLSAVQADDADELERYELLQIGFQSRHWIVRSFAALRAKKFTDLQSLRVLLDRLDNDKHLRVQAIIMHAIIDYPQEHLMATFDLVRADAWSQYMYDKSPFISEQACEFIRMIVGGHEVDNVRKLSRKWKSYRRSYRVKRLALLKKLGLQEKDVQPLPLPSPKPLANDETEEDRQQQQTSAVLPAGFDDFLRRLELHGVNMCVLLDDTSSMGGVITEVRKRILDIMGLMQEITPKYKLGFVTYKDRVNRHFDFSSDKDAVTSFLKELHAAGGGDQKEGPDKALAFALESDKLHWNPEALNMIVILGDQPPHDKDKKEMLRLAELAVSKKMTVNTIGTNVLTSGRAVDVPFFPKVAESGNGLYSRLDKIEELMEIILTLSCGPDYQRDIRPFLKIMIKLRGIELKAKK